MFYAQSTTKGHIREKQNVFLPRVKFWFTTHTDPQCDDDGHFTISPLKIWKHLDKIKLNEPGRQKLGRYRSSVSRHSTQSCIAFEFSFHTKQQTLTFVSFHFDCDPDVGLYLLIKLYFLGRGKKEKETLWESEQDIFPQSTNIKVIR